MTLRSKTPMLAAAVSGIALVAAGCGTASSGHQQAFAVSSPRSASPATAPGSAGSSSCAASAATGAPAQVPALNAIQFVSSRQGWAAGAGQVLATSDGGHTWTRQYSGPAAIDQVDFVDAQHGWAVGASTLLGTANGGATWSVMQDPCGSIRSVHFVTPDLGYAVAGGSQVRLDGGVPAPAVGGRLLTTTDGGQHWAALAGAPAHVQSACFTSASSGFLGTPGKIWSTSDSGRHWSVAFTEPAATGAAHPGPDTAVLQCAGTGAASGAWVLFLGQGAALGHSPYLAYAMQNAQTARPLFEETYIESAARPQLHAPDGPGSYPGPFSAIGPDAAVFVGFNPAVGYGAATVMTVTGSGLSRTANVSAISQAYGVAFVSDTQGWVVGKNARTGEYSIVATANGGHTWTRQYQTR